MHNLYFPYHLGTDSPIPHLFEQITPHLVAEGYEVTMFSNQRSSIFDDNRISEVYAGNPLQDLLAKLVCSLRRHNLIHTGGRAHYRIAQLAHRRNPDLAHVHSFRVDVDASPFPTELKRDLLEMVDVTTAVSKHTARTVESVYGRSPTVIYNGVDNTVFHPDYDRPPLVKRHGLGDPYFVFVGNFVERKRPSDVVTIAKRYPDADFAFFGDGPLFSEIEYKANDISNVHLFGRIDKTRLPAIYANANGLIFPTVREGCPNVVLEAMAAETPVIGYDLTSMPELVNDGETGILVDEPDPERLADTVDILFDNERAREMGVAAREYVAKNHSFDVLAEQYEAVYKRIL